MADNYGCTDKAQAWREARAWLERSLDIVPSYTRRIEFLPFHDPAIVERITADAKAIIRASLTAFGKWQIIATSDGIAVFPVYNGQAGCRLWKLDTIGM